MVVIFNVIYCLGLCYWALMMVYLVPSLSLGERGFWDWMSNLFFLAYPISYGFSWHMSRKETLTHAQKILWSNLPLLNVFLVLLCAALGQ